MIECGGYDFIKTTGTSSRERELREESTRGEPKEGEVRIVCSHHSISVL